MYPPNIIGNYFLDAARREGSALTGMQVMKLVFIAHGWHLGYFSKPLIDEEVESGEYGPNIRTLYRSLRKFGSKGVTESLPTFYRLIDGSDSEALLKSVWQNYRRFSGLQLSTICHQEGSPWHEFTRTSGGRILPDAITMKHFKARIQEFKFKDADTTNVIQFDRDPA